MQLAQQLRLDWVWALDGERTQVVHLVGIRSNIPQRGPRRQQQQRSRSAGSGSSGGSSGTGQYDIEGGPKNVQRTAAHLAETPLLLIQGSGSGGSRRGGGRSQRSLAETGVLASWTGETAISRLARAGYNTAGCKCATRKQVPAVARAAWAVSACSESGSAVKLVEPTEVGPQVQELGCS